MALTMRQFWYSNSDIEASRAADARSKDNSLLKNPSTPLPSTFQRLKNPAFAVFWP